MPAADQLRDARKQLRHLSRAVEALTRTIAALNATIAAQDETIDSLRAERDRLDHDFTRAARGVYALATLAKLIPRFVPAPDLRALNAAVADMLARVNLGRAASRSALPRD